MGSVFSNAYVSLASGKDMKQVPSARKSGRLQLAVVYSGSAIWRSENHETY